MGEQNRPADKSQDTTKQGSNPEGSTETQNLVEPAPVEAAPVQQSAQVPQATENDEDAQPAEVPAELHEYRDVADGVQARVRTPEERAASANEVNSQN